MNLLGLLFATVIVSCGTTHLLDVWTLYRPVYWSSGVAKAFTALASLMTALVPVRMLPTLLEAAAVLHDFFDAAPLGMVVFDEQLRFVRLDQHLADMNHLPVEAHLGRTLQETVPALDPAVASSIAQVRDSGVMLKDMEVRHALPDGRRLHHLLNYFRIQREGGPALVGGMVQDITLAAPGRTAARGP